MAAVGAAGLERALAGRVVVMEAVVTGVVVAATGARAVARVVVVAATGARAVVAVREGA